MACCKCGSDRLIMINAKSSDLNTVEIPHLDIEHDGYLPTIEGLCSGDYVDLTACLECGQIQRFSATSDEQIKESLRIDTDDDDDEPGWNIKAEEDESDRLYEEMLKRKYG